MASKNADAAAVASTAAREEVAAEDIFGADVSRRGFLKGTLTGTVALGAASLLPSGCAKYAEAPSGLAVFNAKEYAIINAAARVYVGADPAEEGVDVAAFFDHYARNFAPWLLDQIKQGLALFEHGPLLFNFSLKTFTQMDEAAQADYAAGWKRSSLVFRRGLNLAIRNICMAGYYLQTPTWKTLGYAGPWIGRVKVPVVAARYPLREGSVKS